ncbi:MAG: RNA polymerase sigma factor [Pirellula sp.]
MTTQLDWGSIFESHRRWLATIVRARLADPEAQADVLQDVALAVISQANRPESPDKIAPWLYRITLRKIVNHHRATGRRRRLMESAAKCIVNRTDFKENTKRGTKISWNALLACCTLFAIGLYAGYQFRYHLKNLSAQAPLADSSNSIEYASPLKVPVESPSNTPIDIPLLDARDIDPQVIFVNNSLEIAKLNQQLKRKGYQVNIKPTVYSGSLEDGRKFVVPIHDLSLRPHGSLIS